MRPEFESRMAHIFDSLFSPIFFFPMSSDGESGSDKGYDPNEPGYDVGVCFGNAHEVADDGGRRGVQGARAI